MVRYVAETFITEKMNKNDHADFNEMKASDKYPNEHFY